MNTAITCDSLLERNHANEIVELLCEAFPDSMIYTLAHKEKAILGTIEQRKIKSTGLSRKVKCEAEMYDNLIILPSLCEGLKLSCQHDYVLNISRGFSHAFSKCDKSKQITYLYELAFEDYFNSFWRRLFRPFITKKFINKLKLANKLLVSHQKLHDDLLKQGVESEVLLPPFRLSDYALFPKNMFKHDFYALDTRGLDFSKVKKLVEMFEAQNDRFTFVGPTDHFGSEFDEWKKSRPENNFFGERCSGEHAPVLASARAFISFDQTRFSKMTFAALAVGRPVVILKQHLDLISAEGVYSVENFNLETLKSELHKVSVEHESLDSQKIRANIMKFHDIKFKAQLKRILDREMGFNVIDESPAHTTSSSTSF